MKEVWVKKTVYRRYLVADEDAEEVRQILIGDPNGCDVICNCYDLNESLEYDEEKTFLPIDFKIQPFNPLDRE